MFTRHLWKHGPRSAASSARVFRSTPVRSRFSSSSSSSTAPSASGTPWLAGLGGACAGGAAVFLYGAGAPTQPAPTSARAVSPTPAAAAVSPEPQSQVPNLDSLGTSDQIMYGAVPSLEEVTQQLNEHAFSFTGTPSGAVDRYDGAQLASNSPCEDAFMHGTMSNPFRKGGDDWMAWAVFDGHCGWQLSNLLTRQLMPFLRRSLGTIQPVNGQPSSEEELHQAIKSAFKTLDDALVKSATSIIESDLPFADKARRLEAAYAGACALLSLFDPASRNLTVASTGDCRAVLGERTADGSWTTRELTVDHTGANEDEKARLRAQFPDEPNMLRGGRVWGMQPSRTFGDGMWKWSAQLKETLRYRFNGLSLPSHIRYSDYKEGPYLTAEPMVTTTKISEAQPSFLILATDGLWDSMKSEEAVGLVGRWLDWQKKGDKASVAPAKSDFGPAVLGWEQQCKYTEEKTALQDSNVAVHLMRNGLGGADEEMVRGALTFRYPNSRDIRDDITVQVVFFNPKA